MSLYHFLHTCSSFVKWGGCDSNISVNTPKCLSLVLYVILVHVLALLLIEWWSSLSEVGRVWCWGLHPPRSRCFASILCTTEPRGATRPAIVQYVGCELLGGSQSVSSCELCWLLEYTRRPRRSCVWVIAEGHFR